MGAKRRKILGVPVGRKRGAVVVAGALGKARGWARRPSRPREPRKIHEIREQLDRANRQSPIEVLLNGLTHRRGAHKREGSRPGQGSHSGYAR